jgi:hypothetical protein
MSREKTRISLHIPVSEKEIVEWLAKSHGLTLSEAMRKGARLYVSFAPGFLETIAEHYRERGLQASVALQLSQQKRIAAERAWLKIFGTLPPGATREIKYEHGKLIRGDDLSKILEHEYTELFQSMKEKLMESQETGEPVSVSAEEFSEFAMML